LTGLDRCAALHQAFYLPKRNPVHLEILHSWWSLLQFHVIIAGFLKYYQTNNCLFEVFTISSVFKISSNKQLFVFCIYSLEYFSNVTK